MEMNRPANYSFPRAEEVWLVDKCEKMFSIRSEKEKKHRNKKSVKYKIIQFLSDKGEEELAGTELCKLSPRFLIC